MPDMKYKVIREHEGDRHYNVGDVRTANPADVKHLLGTVLRPVDVKSAEPPLNKAEPKVLNKSR